MSCFARIRGMLFEGGKEEEEEQKEKNYERVKRLQLHSNYIRERYYLCAVYDTRTLLQSRRMSQNFYD